MDGQTLTGVEIRALPLAAIKLSKTPGQVERRAHFDKGKMAELSASIERHGGVLNPIIVRRPLLTDNLRPPIFEVVAGERRVLASISAGLTEILCSIHDLTDDQVEEIQLIENLQREDLHELAEAEGYEALLKRGHPAEEIAGKVGKSKAYIYARLKLTALCPEARKAFYGGKLNASTALLLARIPIHDLQRQALKKITKPNAWSDEPLSYRDAARHVHENYMLRLDQAPFPTADADLVPKAGPCGSCPKRTGNQRELFGDVKSADVCTDPVCYGAKRDANLARLAAKAEASGKEVIAGAEAKKIAPGGVGTYSHLKGYVQLDDRFWKGGKQCTYRATVGKDVEVKYLQDQESGKLVEIAAEADVKAALKKRGIKDDFGAGGNDRYASQQRAQDRKRKLEREFRTKLYAEIRTKLPTKLARHELELIACRFWKRCENDTQQHVMKRWGWEQKKRRYGSGYEDGGLTQIPKLSDTELALFLQDLAFAGELQVWSYGSSKPEQLLAAARRLKVNAKKIKRELAAAKKPKAKKAAKVKAK